MFCLGYTILRIQWVGVKYRKMDIKGHIETLKMGLRSSKLNELWDNPLDISMSYCDLENGVKVIKTQSHRYIHASLVEFRSGMDLNDRVAIQLLHCCFTSTVNI